MRAVSKIGPMSSGFFAFELALELVLELAFELEDDGWERPFLSCFEAFFDSKVGNCLLKVVTDLLHDIANITAIACG